MIKYGFQSSKFNNLTLEQELEFSTNNKIDFFDLHFDDYCPNDINEVDLPKSFTITLPENFENLSDEQKNCFINFIREKNPKTVTVKFGNLSLETLKELIVRTPKTKICVENIFPDLNIQTKKHYVDFLLLARELFQKEDLKFYATFDTGHAKVAGYNPVSLIKKLIKHEIEIYTVHLHDNDGKTDSHWPAGSVFNGIDFEEIIKIISTINHDVFAVIEHWNNNYNALEYLKNL